MKAQAPPLHQPEAADAASLSDQAYFRLRELIVTLALAPGSAVHERELMRLLKLGRTPIREALLALARDGLVDAYPRRGMFVAPVDAGDLAGLSEVRAALEPMAARLAAARATPADRAVIEELLDEVGRVSDTGDERMLIDLDQRIHRHVYRSAHNAFLERTLNQYYVLALRVWFIALDRVANLEDAVGQHRAILEAIREGDADTAARVMRRHIEAFEHAIRSVL